MKLDKFKSFLEKQYENPFEDDFDDESYYNSDEYLFKGAGAGDDDVDAGMENVCQLIRDMFNLAGIKAVVSNKGMDITVDVQMKKKDTLSNTVRVFDIVKKLKKDVLEEYESEFELWKTKEGNPLMIFYFYEDGVSPL